MVGVWCLIFGFGFLVSICLLLLLELVLVYFVVFSFGGGHMIHFGIPLRMNVSQLLTNIFRMNPVYSLPQPLS